MFEQVKLILTTQYQNEINRFDELKKEIEDIEYKMKDETSEIEYKGALKELRSHQRGRWGIIPKRVHVMRKPVNLRADIV